MRRPTRTNVLLFAAAYIALQVALIVIVRALIG
jgi:hypothetical protein